MKSNSGTRNGDFRPTVTGGSRTCSKYAGALIMLASCHGQQFDLTVGSSDRIGEIGGVSSTCCSSHERLRSLLNDAWRFYGRRHSLDFGNDCIAIARGSFQRPHDACLMLGPRPGK